LDFSGRLSQALPYAHFVPIKFPGTEQLMRIRPASGKSGMGRFYDMRPLILSSATGPVIHKKKHTFPYDEHKPLGSALKASLALCYDIPIC
jgi:hypothetical protein